MAVIVYVYNVRLSSGAFGRASSRLFDWSSRAGGAEPPVDVGKIREKKKKKCTEKKEVHYHTNMWQDREFD